MSEDQTTQTAVDATNPPAQPGAAVQDAQTNGDDLDALLKEYETTTAPAAATTTASPAPQAGTDTIKTPTPDPAIADVQRYIFRQDMDKTVAAIRGDLPADYFDDTLVKSWINARADEDPRLAQAWVNRHTNPKQFEKVVGSLKGEFAKKYGKLPDKQATDDRIAVADAVRGASTKAPVGQAPDFSRLSDAQFAAEKDKMFG